MLKEMTFPLDLEDFMASILDLFDPAKELQAIKIILDLHTTIDQATINQENKVNTLQDLYAKVAQVAAFIAEIPLAVGSNNDDQTPKMLELAIVEILKNAIEHGLLGIGYRLKTELLVEPAKFEQYADAKIIEIAKTIMPQQLVFVRLTKSVKQADQLQIEVADPSISFNLVDLSERPAEAGQRHGLGGAIIKEVLPDLKVELNKDLNGKILSFNLLILRSKLQAKIRQIVRFNIFNI